ncbi:LysM peptidoglycan-binding domain-containing protein [Stenotrophomonas maltophilia]|jgi:nucleoid-associated protein YgaU|uniref:LysM peptidoglycan-binding domain-containing protein n=2 Tax=Gammaproteobacteria TaxID=1236 RepID=UPI00201D0BC0|nr:MULTISPECIES: LysM peptidoglycan-binding domain-containing protein [Stenotrophomonas]MBN5025392.1 LysM peptidoglycan-binding domain-containing protein [Stenotrophomonas maltophilia]MDH1272149.1 LysM peptidoglycan-binding domain-containing protein [Stenotrophomonas sp. GD03937]MDH1486328.1 LysM peptidoglycan-binding domain-containing protein [Stenotrophomonas sp. GD03712]MDR2960371.1 LysM peptidoglycan-binding domain-containing protein [Stenotrophomonas sp.]UQY95000.1 LysM peptidoglycan-bind
MLLRFRTVVAAAMLTVAAYATAVEVNGGHPDTYVVRKGDTLWDIAARFLQKPWLWPEIWQANPQIANPHLIYPGDVLSLAYLDRVTVAAQPGPRQEAPIDAIPLAQVEPFLKQLSVVDSVKQLPYVVGLEDNRLRVSGGDTVYVRLADAQVGQRWAVVRPTVRYAQPKPTEDLTANGDVTPGSGNLWKAYNAPNARRGVLGYELAQVATGTITQIAGGKVEASTLVLDKNVGGREVRSGDRLVPIEARPYDLQFVPHVPAAGVEGVDVRVLAVTDMFTAGGPRDVIAISAGRAQGVDNGTVFSLWRPGRHVAHRMKYPTSSRMDDALGTGAGRVSLPDEYAAHAMVFRTFDNVSYALVMQGVKPVRVGYNALHPDAK